MLRGRKSPQALYTGYETSGVPNGAQHLVYMMVLTGKRAGAP